MSSFQKPEFMLAKQLICSFDSQLREQLKQSFNFACPVQNNINSSAESMTEVYIRQKESIELRKGEED